MATAVPVECPACFRRSLLSAEQVKAAQEVVCARCGTAFRVPAEAISFETKAPKKQSTKGSTTRRIPVARGEQAQGSTAKEERRRPGVPALPKSRGGAADGSHPNQDAAAAAPSDVQLPSRPRRRRPGTKPGNGAPADADNATTHATQDPPPPPSKPLVPPPPGRRHPAVKAATADESEAHADHTPAHAEQSQSEKAESPQSETPPQSPNVQISDVDVPIVLRKAVHAAAAQAEPASESDLDITPPPPAAPPAAEASPAAQGEATEATTSLDEDEEPTTQPSAETDDPGETADDEQAQPSLAATPTTAEAPEPTAPSKEPDTSPEAPEESAPSEAPDASTSSEASDATAAAEAVPEAVGTQTGRIVWPEPPEVEARPDEGEWEDSSDSFDLPPDSADASRSSSERVVASASISASMWSDLHGFPESDKGDDEPSQEPTKAGAAALDPFDIGPHESSDSNDGDPFGSSAGTPAVIDTGDLGFEDWTGTTFHPMNPAASHENDTMLAENVVEALAVETEFNPFLGDFAPAEPPESLPEEPGPQAWEPESPPLPAGGARMTGTIDRSKAMPSQRLSAVSQVGQAVRAAVAGMTGQGHKRSGRAPSLASSRLPGITLGRVAEIEPPPTPKLISEAKPAPERIPAPGGKLTLDGATYTVMDPDEALERLLRTGDLPEHTYVHDLDLGYVPSDWNNPGNWHLRTPVHARMVAQEEAFYIPRQGPNAPDCLAVVWPRRPLKLHRCAFGTLNLNRAAFPLGASITRCKVLYRVAAVRVRFDARADFDGTTLPMRSTFYQLHATGGVSFAGCRFEGSTSLARAHIEGYASLRNAEIHGDLDLSQLSAGAELDLREMIVLGRTHLRGIRVMGALDLGRAGMHGELDLTEAGIDGSLRADELACGSGATLERCRVGGDADFTQARFAGTLGLAHVRMRGEARFGRCQFGALVDGYRMEVDGAFDLTEAVMHGDAVFATSRFQGLVRLNVDPLSRVRVESTQKAAEFRGIARFDHCVFSKPLVGSATRFHGRVTFRRATFEESASFAEASFATGCDFSHAFAGKELDLRNATLGGRLALDGMHVGGRAMLKGARFRALSLSEATLDVLTLERHQLFPDERDLRDNGADPEVPPFKQAERHRPAKLFHYRHAVMGPDPSVPGAKPQRLSKAQRREQHRARLRGGLDAQLKLEEGGARLLAFDKAREEFALLRRSFAALGQSHDEDWAYVLTRRMQRATWVLAGRGIKPVDEALLAVEREIAALEEMRELVDAEQVEHERFPRELAQRREELMAREAAKRVKRETRNGASASNEEVAQGVHSTRSAGWPRLKELTLKAIRARLEPLRDKRERILDRLRSLEVPRPRNEFQRITVPLAWQSRCLTDATMDRMAAYGTRPLRILAVALVMMSLFALFYVRHSYWEDATLPAQPSARAEQRALQLTPVVQPHAAAQHTTADPISELSLSERTQLYTLYSAGVMVGHGWHSNLHPRPGHWLMWLVVLQTILGITLLLLFIAAAVRRLLR